MGRCHANTSQLNTRALAPMFSVPCEAGSLWGGQSRLVLGWVLASAEGHTESCKLDESDKRCVLGRLAKGLTRQSVGFLQS